MLSASIGVILTFHCVLAAINMSPGAEKGTVPWNPAAVSSRSAHGPLMVCSQSASGEGKCSWSVLKSVSAGPCCVLLPYRECRAAQRAVGSQSFKNVANFGYSTDTKKSEFHIRRNGFKIRLPHFGIFWLPVYCPITKCLQYIQLQFFLLICMGVKLGFSQWGAEGSTWNWEERCEGRLERELHNEQLHYLCAPNVIQWLN
jgi:hypothetical protein